jgi:diguanylate cyclase (GGDEF)-like protein
MQPMITSKIDPTTGFLDRYSCLQMAAELVGNVRKAGQPLAALWIDLDRFKQVNESYGYLSGDNVIAFIAQRLRENIKGRAEIGRMGADEFVCLLPDFNRDNAERLAGELMHAIETPLEMGEVQLRPSASIGIAILESEDATFSFLERADRAKISAKKQGGNRYVVSGDEMVSGRMGTLLAREELAVEYMLFNALETGGLQLHYQPIVGFDGRVQSVEALMRCTINGKAIHPSRFVPVAEKTGLIVRLGEWSLLQGARQARHLLDAGLCTRVAVNISRAQLLDSKFSQALHAALICANVDPELIELELTESLFMDNSNIVQANLRNVRECRVSLSIDDFGTGYSCLANLKDIPASKLKLDRAFVQFLPHDRRAMSVVKAIVQLGKDLGMTVVAEGVEKKEQLDALRELGVDGIQGYYYAQPMNADALFLWLKENQRK